MLNLESIKQNILGKIVNAKLDWVAERKQTEPLEGFQASLTPSDRDFTAALSSGRTGFILECKKASPSKGLIREDFHPAAIAKAYRPYASAISVLTDEAFFQGNFAFLPQVRAEVDCPVLCKDFIIDPYQIYLARHYQADAILLMLSVLTDAGYQALSAVAQSLNLGILTEVSNEDELERAIRLNARVIGINNRNLRDLTIDLQRTRELAPQIPEDRVIICESGLYSHDQIKALSHYAHGFLVGSSLMSQPDIDLACRKLILGENKVCGLTRAEDAVTAQAAGAVYGGLIFAEKSPRYLTLEQAADVMQAAPLQYIGVFQNAPLSQIINTVNQLDLAGVQLHGQETPEEIAALRQQLPAGTQIWKAIAIADELPLAPLQTYAPLVDRLLLDRQVGNQSGGTGQSFDWQLLDSLDKQQLMLAGGISPATATAASRIGCRGLDLNSGVESAPGIKDKIKVQQAFAALRDY